jgi:hypothetical protein
MSSAAQPFSTPEQNKQLVLRWFDEVWNQGRTFGLNVKI